MKKRGHPPIDVALAKNLYKKLGKWRLVAASMTRPNGLPYQWFSIARAVGKQK
jgi:hypothetical protein